uniref:Huntingtin-interacting protein K-like n=1 Tax=Sinocyclocheilus grahami TaxID=75366 RepID=A0A672KI69_SINGR
MKREVRAFQLTISSFMLPRNLYRRCSSPKTFAYECCYFNFLTIVDVSLKAMSVIGDRRSREQKAKQEREKELAKVTIKKEDVELIMGEMEISRAVAERSLREHMGNVVEALIALTN